MRFKGFIVFLLFIFCSYGSFSQIQGELTQSRILILLDESSSMVQKWEGGKEKYKAADELILKLMDSIYAVNNQVEFSLRVFGHQHTVAENDCYDTKNEVAFSRDNRTQMAYRLEDIRPLGVTPIAYSLKQAAEHDLVDVQHNAYSIILITDGGESCGGDICEVMNTLIKNKVYFRPYIISLEDYPGLKTTYSCMGDYLQVTREPDIPKAVGTIVDAFRPIIKITKEEYKQMQIIASGAPSILKVNIPLIKPTMPSDTAAPGIKTWKDTTAVTAPPPTPKPAPAPERPAAEKIAGIARPPLMRFRTEIPHATKMKTIEVGISLPPVTLDTPIAPPVVVVKIPEPQKIAHLTPAKPKNFNIYSDYNSPVLHLSPIAVNITLPPVVIDTPKPAPVVIKLPPAEKISHLSRPHAKEMTTAIIAVGAPVSITPRPLPPIVVEAPVPPAPKPIPVAEKPAPEKISRLARAHLQEVAINITATAAPKSVKTRELPPVVIEAPAPPPAPVITKPAAEKIARVNLAKPALANVVFVIEDHPFLTRRPPSLPPIKYDAIAKVPAGKNTPIADVQPTSKKIDFTVTTEIAKETSLEVFIVNKRGENVTTSPQVVLVDPATNKEVKKFYRTVDPSGNPDPQTNIPVGTYNLTFPIKKSLVINNVRLEQNKKNKVIIRLKDVSLSFYYFGTDKPVKEFVAQVIERDKPHGRVQDQKCTERLEYEPGTYHIIINTFPVQRRYVDLDMDDETGIGIEQPGYAKFTSDIKTAVTLWCRDGDKFKPFHTLDLNDPVSQHLQIQPGEYQAHYHKGPGQNYASEKVLLFSIKSNETTTIELK